MRVRPPEERQVLHRSWCLSAMVARAFIDERPSQPTSIGINAQILPWIEHVRCGSELEGWEAAALTATLGELEPAHRERASWFSEGVGVLAWALTRYDPPPYDVVADAQTVTSKLDFLDFAAPNIQVGLRPAPELQNAHRRALAIHWRLSQFEVNHQAIDFAAAPKSHPLLSSATVAELPLVDGDLMIGNHSISRAPADRVAQVGRIALERFRAFQWLMGDDAVFSRVTTDL